MKAKDVRELSVDELKVKEREITRGALPPAAATGHLASWRIP